MTRKKGTNNDDYLKGTARDDLLQGLGGNDSLYGTGGNDTLDGGAGDDELLGGDGNDLLLPGKNGYDAIHGGKGTDTVSYANFEATLGVNITGRYPEIALGTFDATGDTYRSIEIFIGSSANDQIVLQRRS